MAVSTGNVMNRSTSSGGNPGELVSTCTWILVTSGTASMGSASIELMPIATISSHSTMTRNRLLSEKSTIFVMTKSANVNDRPPSLRAAPEISE